MAARLAAQNSAHGRGEEVGLCANTLPIAACVCDDAAMAADADSGVDFALVVAREDGAWQVDVLPPKAGESLDTFLHALRQQIGEGSTLGFVSVAEDFFIAARVLADDVRLLVSDVAAAGDWPLPADVLDHLGLDEPEGADLDEVTPGGDLAIFDDLGLPTMEMAMLCDNLDLYPDEQIATVAARLGFGEQFEVAIDAVLD